MLTYILIYFLSTTGRCTKCFVIGIIIFVIITAVIVPCLVFLVDWGNGDEDITTTEFSTTIGMFIRDGKISN